jgi:hypothetical protein
VQLESKEVEPDTRIDPALKQWLDNILVPVMVREYLAICRTEGDNGLSSIPSEDSDPSNPERFQ